MGSRTKVFVDTSWFKALADPDDDFHPQAHSQLTSFPSSTELITTNFVLDETFTLIRVKVNLDASLDFQKTIRDLRPNLKIVRVLARDEQQAWNWFPNNWRKLSFTDCTSFAVMQRLDLTQVATFDQHFRRAGFHLL